MKNWKIIAIIAATAVATGIAVVILLQKQAKKRKMRFDSNEFDDEEYMDDIACGEQCNFCNSDLDVVLPDEAPAVEEADEADAE
ncbi:MAG: hypothetical protein IJN11_02485 [Oscillospiraceae bacterium]|nr:hypothetical protein [Ruminococcus sp.]MBQ7004660.1 hypothetical protein [Oscillospiraceae bacterium]MBQ7012768.1 hypothetical protein [Oscillospiraceae bacterium]